MEKVYIVYYDNGQQWEDHQVSVDCVFASKESAEAHAEQGNASIREFKCSMTKEEFDKITDEDVRCHYTYESFVEMEHYEWMMYSNSKYFVTETPLHP